MSLTEDDIQRLDEIMERTQQTRLLRTSQPVRDERRIAEILEDGVRRAKEQARLKQDSAIGAPPVSLATRRLLEWRFRDD